MDDAQFTSDLLDEASLAGLDLEHVLLRILDRAICLGEAAGGGALLLFEMPTGPHHPVACVSRPGSGADLAQWNGD